MDSTQPMWVRLGWVGLDLCDGLGWVEFFFLTHYGRLGQKIPLTRPNPTHAHLIDRECLIFNLIISKAYAFKMISNM